MANIINKIKTNIGDRLSSISRLEKTIKEEGIWDNANRASAAFPRFNGVPDFRPKLVVPYDYLSSELTAGPNNYIRNARGIIFPYTPDIRQEYTASFSSKELTHSNYPFYYYQNSNVGKISLSFKFTVQNTTDAHYYLAMIHLLRSLVKMKFGIDPDAGSPPPVCRLYAYGTYMFDNVPVAISSFNVDLDSNIDYYTLDSQNTTIVNLYSSNNTVPTLSTFQLGLIPIYSRAEMKEFSVQEFLNKSRTKGYL